MRRKNNETSDKAPPKARGHLWAKGQSGNPAGARRGSRRRATLLVESMYKGEAEALVRKVISLGLAGDVAALKIAMDRLLPPLKSRPIQFKLPTLRTISDALAAITMFIQGVTAGEILADEAQSLTDMVGVFIRALEVSALEDRSTALEKANAGAPAGRYDA